MKVTISKYNDKIYYLSHTEYITLSGPTGSVCVEHETMEEAELFVKKAEALKKKWIDKQLGRDL